MPHPRITYRPALLLLVAAVVLAGCPDRPAEEVEMDAPFNDGVTPDELIGTWLLIEQAGIAPETLWTVTFTTTGDYIVQSETRALDYQHYFLTGEDLIAVTDEIGGEATQYYEFEISGERLYLRIPGTDASAILERRDDLLELREDVVPPVQVDPHPDEVEPLLPEERNAEQE